MEKLIGEQFKGKEKLFDANKHALHLGRDWVMMNLEHPIGLRLKRANAVGDRIFIEGNSAAALGAVYGGATVCAWYPITPSSSLAEAFTRHCQRMRVDPATKKNKFAIVQAEDELASIGIVIGAGLERRARLHRDLGPRHFADAGVPRARLFRRNSRGDFRRAARRPLDRHADAHAADRHPLLRLRLARRHQARAAVSRGPGRGVRVRRRRLRSRRPAANADLRHARSRYRHEPSPVRGRSPGTTAANSTAAR